MKPTITAFLVAVSLAVALDSSQAAFGSVGAQDSLVVALADDGKEVGDSASANTGKCEFKDLNGNDRCESNWSEFQCQQAAGTFTPGEECDE